MLIDNGEPSCAISGAAIESMSGLKEYVKTDIDLLVARYGVHQEACRLICVKFAWRCRVR